MKHNAKVIEHELHMNENFAFMGNYGTNYGQLWIQLWKLMRGYEQPSQPIPNLS